MKRAEFPFQLWPYITAVTLLDSATIRLHLSSTTRKMRPDCFSEVLCGF